MDIPHSHIASRLGFLILHVRKNPRATRRITTSNLHSNKYQFQNSKQIVLLLILIPWIWRESFLSLPVWAKNCSRNYDLPGQRPSGFPSKVGRMLKTVNSRPKCVLIFWPHCISIPIRSLSFVQPAYDQNLGSEL